MENNRYEGAVIRISGIVQGVGFRPFVFRSARKLELKGSVRNTDSGVLITVDGDRVNIERLFEEIRRRPPVLAEIHSSSLSFCPPHGFSDFSIISSVGTESGFIPISPDIATCDDCLSDVLDPANRRYRYPFTNCTNCGPRFTIIRSIPYDRENTTMNVFPMCEECASEYEDPSDRRYHAQPNACPVCGPRLTLLTADGRRITREPVRKAVSLLRDGRILAVKGLGGYHLAVDPANHGAVERLRNRKRRRGKAFALMARDLSVVRRYCATDPASEELLTGFERPIVLLERRPDAPALSPGVAPDVRTYGVMLPYTPLHHLLFREGPDLLVMTSANLSEEPLAYRDPDAMRRLAGIADAFLSNDREIERPCDDSVLLSVGGISFPLRRSRGYVPRPIRVGTHPYQLVAAGASEKNSFCVIKDGLAFVSHHIGDLDNEKSVDAYIRGVEDFLHMFRVSPEAVACDLHPDYESSRFSEEFARTTGVDLVRVQHHHAHIASVLAEHGYGGRVIGVAFDGTGYGTDGTLWGGEFLLADTGGFERAGHFKPIPMPGGERCILETDRMALSYLVSAYGSAEAIPAFGFFDGYDEKRRSVLTRIIAAGPDDELARRHRPLTSSCGRLFDAAASLTGLCSRPCYEAQGAMLLETAAGMPRLLPPPYPYRVAENGVLDFSAMIREMVEDIRRGEAVESVSRRFHATIVHSASVMCARLREKTGLNTVAVSGGVFQNRLIFRFLVDRLTDQGFTVLYPRLVPPNDGGVCLGQGMVALNALGRGEKCA